MAPGVAREHVGHALHVGPREIPGKTLARRADAELAFGQVDRLNSRLQRQPKRTEAVPRIDAVAIEFAGAAGRQDESVAEEDDDP